MSDSEQTLGAPSITIPTELEPLLLRGLFQKARDPILVAELESGSILMGNESAHRLTHFHPGEWSGITLADFFPEGKAIRYLEALKQSSQGDTMLFHDISLQAKSGDRLPCSLHAHRIRADAMGWLILTIIDESWFWRYQKSVKALIKKLKEKAHGHDDMTPI